MNQEKIGRFISQLRKEKNISQEQLAEKLYISRQAISKWELGKSLPDSLNLQKLGEIFDVTVNELLTGEHIIKENDHYIINYNLNLYNDNNKKKLIIKKLIITLLILFIIFLIYYSIMSYNSIKIYTIRGNSENTIINNGLLIITKEKMYFQLGEVTNKSEEKIKKLKLYYKDKIGNSKTIFYCKECNNILLIDKSGYNEYFKINDLENLKKSLKVEIQYENDNETIKLKLKKDYFSKSIFFR